MSFMVLAELAARMAGSTASLDRELVKIIAFQSLEIVAQSSEETASECLSALLLVLHHCDDLAHFARLSSLYRGASTGVLKS